MNSAARSAQVWSWVSSLYGVIRWHITSNDENLMSNKLKMVHSSRKRITKLTFRSGQT